MSSPPKPAHVRADIDPEKAPETVANIREHAAKYGGETMTTSAKELNTKAETGQRRQEAIGHVGKVPGMDIDEEAPASFRKPGDQTSTKAVPEAESHCKY